MNAQILTASLSVELASTCAPATCGQVGRQARERSSRCPNSGNEKDNPNTVEPGEELAFVDDNDNGAHVHRVEVPEVDVTAFRPLRPRSCSR
jgi:hypothetical protein